MCGRVALRPPPRKSKRSYMKKLTEEGRENLIKKNMWVVEHFIKNYKHLMSYSELKSAGLYGLIKGVDKYDPTKGTKVSTYVRHWVKAEVLSSLYENRNVHIPWNRINAYIKDVNDDKIFASLTGHGHAITRVHRNTKEHQKMIPTFEISLDQRKNDPDSNDNGSDHIELQSSLSSADLHIKENKELQEHLNFALDNADLSPIEKLTLSYRFGLDGDEPKTLREIGALTGYTTMGIQKAEKRALGKLKNDSLIKELLV